MMSGLELSVPPPNLPGEGRDWVIELITSGHEIISLACVVKNLPRP